MTFARFVAARYFRAQRRGVWSAVTTVLGVAGVTIGVAALITTLSVMNGFQADIQKKVIGAKAHLSVHGSLDAAGLERVTGALRAKPEVVATSPFVLGQAIVTYRGRSTGVVVKGLDPRAEFKVNDLGRSLEEGSWDPVARGSSKPGAPPGIVLGAELGSHLGAWVGGEVVLVSPQGLQSPMGLMPKLKRFRVAGLVRTGYYEFDSATAYASLPEAASFFGLPPGGASGVQARLTDIEAADRLEARLQKELGYGYSVQSFRAMNRTLFAALRLEKYVMFLVLTLIILVASFNITSNLVLLGAEKLRDIGILKAMGATPAQIRRIFLWEGLMMGSWGVGLGVVFGLTLCWLIRTYPLVELPADIYYLSRVPVHVDPLDVAAVTASGLVLALVSSVFPAWRAARARPVEAILDV